MVDPNLTVATVPYIQLLGENILIAIIILLLGLVIGKLIGTALNRLFLEIQIDKNLGKLKKSNVSIGKSISSFISLGIYIAAIVLALLRVSLFKPLVLIIAYAAAVVIMGAAILSLTDFFPNLIAGIRIRNKKTIELEKKIEIKTAKGIIKKIGILHTHLEGKNKEVFSIPNSLFLDKKNYKLI